MQYLVSFCIDMLRRNGKLSSCEPCRKSKISCDHRHPVCHKCERRGRARLCFYHPAPMSQIKDLRTGTSSRLPEQRSHAGAIEKTRDGSNAADFWTMATESTTVEPIHPPFQSTGRTGATSSSAEVPTASTSNILEALWPFSRIEKSIRKFFDLALGSAIPEPFLLNALPELRRQIEEWDATGRSLDDIFNEICENTKVPFVISKDLRAVEFHLQYTKNNLRLEFIGLLFALTGLSNLLMPSTPIEETLKSDEHMVEISNTCITICRQLGSENEIMLWLLYANCLQLSNIYGDSSQAVWRRFGDATSDLFALGFHKNSDDANIPLFASEIRKRMFSYFARADKNLATFLGRPPRIPRHYCDVRMPLDLSGEDLLLEGTMLEAALTRLDPDGWNTDLKVRTTSILRMRYELAIFKEETLELSKSDPSREVAQKLINIRDNARIAWDKLPQHLHYKETMWEEGSSTTVNLTLLVCYLDFVYNEFLIQRILTRNVEFSNVELLQLAMMMLSELITVTKKRNYVTSEGGSFTRDLPWLLLNFGLPVAGVLTTEFRNCALSNIPLDKSISRSKLIRNISVLIGCLEWLPEPEHRYYSLCKDANEKLGSMLDEALDHQYQATFPAANTDVVPMNLQGQDAAMNMDPNVPMDSEAFLAWLESIDWNRTMPSF